MVKICTLPAVVLTALSLSACIKQYEVHTTQLGSEEAAAYQRLVIYAVEDLPRQSYTVLERGRGLSCDRAVFEGEVSRDEAMEQLKIHAAMVRADAVTNVVCEYKEKVDMEDQCFRSWVCAGDAIHITNPMLIPTPYERVVVPAY